jgi:hypothetical protein
MAVVVRMPATPAQRALARYREEERAFGLVLEVLKQQGYLEDVFLRVFTVYRTRMRHLRRLHGALRGVEGPSASDELRRFRRDRDP